LTSQPQPQNAPATGAAPSADPQQWLAAAAVDAAVYDLRPDYRVMLMTADGLRGGPSDAVSEQMLAEAEQAARQLIAGCSLEELPHLAAWREAYRAFGAKPQRTRPSVEALLRRLDTAELPRVDRITDVYNAISISHLIPMGGENRAAYVGAPRLVRADGREPFDTTAHGELAVEQPSPGEVIWCDDAGVTCRRWNWRQCTRTRITPEVSSVVFILDVLDPVTDEGLQSAANALEAALFRLSPHASVQRRLLSSCSRSSSPRSQTSG
jgi:DNA/RNA-binding domain of Phe-tRNA-synthetase-like protein